MSQADPLSTPLCLASLSILLVSSTMPLRLHTTTIPHYGFVVVEVDVCMGRNLFFHNGVCFRNPVRHTCDVNVVDDLSLPDNLALRFNEEFVLAQIQNQGHQGISLLPSPCAMCCVTPSSSSHKYVDGLLWNTRMISTLHPQRRLPTLHFRDGDLRAEISERLENVMF